MSYTFLKTLLAVAFLNFNAEAQDNKVQDKSTNNKKTENRYPMTHALTKAITTDNGDTISELSLSKSKCEHTLIDRAVSSGEKDTVKCFEKEQNYLVVKTNNSTGVDRHFTYIFHDGKNKPANGLFESDELVMYESFYGFNIPGAYVHKKYVEADKKNVYETHKVISATDSTVYFSSPAKKQHWPLTVDNVDTTQEKREIKQWKKAASANPKASGGCKVTMPIIQLINDTKDSVTTLNCGFGQFHDATLDPSKITQSTDYYLEIQTGNKKKEKSVYHFLDGKNGQPKDGVFQTEEWVRKLKGTRSSTQKNSPLIWTEFINTGDGIYKYPVNYKNGVITPKTNGSTTFKNGKVVDPFNL